MRTILILLCLSILCPCFAGMNNPPPGILPTLGGFRYYDNAGNYTIDLGSNWTNSLTIGAGPTALNAAHIKMYSRQHPDFPGDFYLYGNTGSNGHGNVVLVPDSQGSVYVLRTNLESVVTTETFDNYDTKYSADGVTLKKTGSTFSVQPWIPDNLLSLRFETWNHFEVQERGLLDGPGYWFSDENGISAEKSTNYIFSSGYANQVMMVATQEVLSSVFDADASSYIDFGSPPYASTGITVCCWVKVSSTIGYDMVVSDDSEGLRGITLFVMTGDPIVFAWTDNVSGGAGFGTLPDNKAVEIGKWYFVCARSDANTDATALLYTTNSILDSYNEVSTSAAIGDVTPNNLWIGARNQPDKNHFNGNITKVMIWDRYLSNSEVETVLNGGIGGQPQLSSAPYNAGLTIYAPLGEVLDGGTTNQGTLGGTGIVYDVTIETGTVVGVSASLSPLSIIASTNTLLSFVPSSAYASSVVNVGDNAIAASNVALGVSRDGGSTWSDSLNVTIGDSWDVSNKLITATISLTNQPIGSNVLARIQLTNGCAPVVVKGIAAPCGE